MPIDQGQPALGFLPLIELSWEGGTERYVRADNDLTINGNPYVAMPELEIKMSAQGGGTEDKPVKLVVPISASPFDRLVINEHAPIEVTIAEGDIDDLVTSRTVVYVGELAKTTTRFNGKTRLMEVEVWGRKAFMKDVSLGVKATDRCPWFFGDNTCGASVNSVSATVDSINGTRIDFVNLPNDSAKGSWSPGRYTRGYVEHNGLRIVVLKHHVGSDRLTLARNPPQIDGYTWVGETITLYEGCDKSIDACEAHGQQAYFGGIGRKMPKYNPIIEARP